MVVKWESISNIELETKWYSSGYNLSFSDANDPVLAILMIFRSKLVLVFLFWVQKGWPPGIFPSHSIFYRRF